MRMIYLARKCAGVYSRDYYNRHNMSVIASVVYLSRFAQLWYILPILYHEV
jgi:hypothetical protein